LVQLDRAEWRTVQRCTSSSGIINGPCPSGGCAESGWVMCRLLVRCVALEPPPWGCSNDVPWKVSAEPVDHVENNRGTVWTTHVIGGCVPRSAMGQSGA
jgi:hypothetical protein